MPKQLHHFVPRFYLRGFVDPKHNGVWTYERDEPAPKLLRVDAIAARNNYYTVELGSGTKTNVFEELFPQLEGLASPILKKLIDTGTADLSVDKKGVFSYFLSFGHLRIPKFRDELEDTMRGILTEFSMRLANDRDFFSTAAKKLEESTGEQIGDQERLKHAVLSGQVHPVVHPEFSLVKMIEHVGFLAHRIGDMRWTVRQADRSVQLVTSDNPVVLHNLTMLKGGTPDARALEVIFPLSPSRMFLASWDGHVGEGPMRPALARQMNKLIALAANQYVYSSTPIPAISKYLRAPRKRMLDFEELKRRIFDQG